MVEVKKKVCLIVIDGWGISENKEGNKILFLQKTTLFVVGVHCSSEPLSVRLFYMYVLKCLHLQGFYCRSVATLF